MVNHRIWINNRLSEVHNRMYAYHLRKLRHHGLLRAAPSGLPVFHRPDLLLLRVNDPLCELFDLRLFGLVHSVLCHRRRALVVRDHHVAEGGVSQRAGIHPYEGSTVSTSYDPGREVKLTVPPRGSCQR